ncbi:MAG TPA: ATP-binding cassette domain-containing protein, partial [Candidatus Deferrimicrobium sp.]|nr:ATP-binding cassette domain-containing protein [Candidatus Deferrimicrobium sp.]
MSIIIETKDLTKIYDKNVVVDHLNFEIKKGELLSLLGPNGAGKSTTIKMLTTILKPDEGTALVKG